MLATSSSLAVADATSSFSIGAPPVKARKVYFSAVGMISEFSLKVASRTILIHKFCEMSLIGPGVLRRRKIKS
jgi:hypothetical protein